MLKADCYVPGIADSKVLDAETRERLFDQIVRAAVQIPMTRTDFQYASPNAHLLIGEMPAPRQMDGRWWEGTGVSIAALWLTATRARAR